MSPESFASSVPSIPRSISTVSARKVVAFSDIAATEICRRKKRKKAYTGICRETSGTWRASCGMKPGPDGRLVPDRLYGFASPEEAARARQARLDEKARGEAKGRELTVTQLADAAAAVARLDAAGIRGPAPITAAMSEYLALRQKLDAAGHRSTPLEAVVVDYLDRHPSASKTTVSEFFTEWIACKTKAGLDGVSITHLKNKMRQFLRLHGERLLTDIRLEHVESVVNDPTAAPQTRIHRRSILKQFFLRAVHCRKIAASENPTAYVKRPKKQNGRPDPYAIADAGRLLNLTLSLEDRFRCTALVATGLFTGIRIEEMLQLHFCDDEINIARGIVTVPENVSKTGQLRRIPMSPNLRRILQHLQNRPRARLKYQKRNRQWPSDPGSLLCTKNVLKAYRKALKGLGFRWHKNGLRSSFGSYKYEETNYNKQLVLEYMGHVEDSTVFERHYKWLVTRGDGEKYFALLPTGLTASAAPAELPAAT